MVVGPLLRSLCSSTRRSLSSSSSLFKSSLLLQRIPGLNNRHFSAAAAPASSASSAAPGRSFDPTRLRNVAVIAHDDHGKTTLMDRLLRQCGADIPHERALDNISSLERERGGITISSKATSSPCGEHEGVIWSLDWRSLGAITPIRNQGNFNTCWAFVAITTVEALHFIRSGELLALSVQQLIDCDQCNQDCNIGSVTDAYNYIAQHGITLQDIYPYTLIISTCRMKLVAQKKVEISGYEYFDFSENEVRLLQAVSRQPVSIVVF